MAKHAQHGRMKHFNRYFTMIARQPQLNVHHDCHQMDPQATVSSAGTVEDQMKGYVSTAMVGLSAPVSATQTVDQRSYVRTTNTHGVHRLVCLECGAVLQIAVLGWLRLSGGAIVECARQVLNSN